MFVDIMLLDRWMPTVHLPTVKWTKMHYWGMNGFTGTDTSLVGWWFLNYPSVSCVLWEDLLLLLLLKEATESDLFMPMYH